MSEKHLEDIFLEGEGIFQAIADIEGFELWDSETAALMDEHYVNDYSGMKILAYIFAFMLLSFPQITSPLVLVYMIFLLAAVSVLLVMYK